MAKRVFVFNAKLVGVKGVRRTVAVRGDQELIDLHHVLREAFGWQEDHLFALWPTGKFWPREGVEYVHPFALEFDPFADWDLPVAGPSRTSAEICLGALDLTEGQRLAYLFDFGDEWRVLLTLRQITADDGGHYPRLLESVGEAPPQYPDYEEDAA